MSEVAAVDRLETALSSLPKEERERLVSEVMAGTKHLKWVPSPGPQLSAYNSEADVLLFGGAPGGGKSQLLLGLAFNKHKKSLLMRRQYTDLTGASGLVETALRVHGSKDGFNGAPPPTLKVSPSCAIDFGAAAQVGDEQRWMGRDHDALLIDEATQWAEMQIRFLMGWVRSPDPKQRCRVVLATNPPLTSEGIWVIKMFAPWIDKQYPYPARPGELRWVVSDEEGNDKWVDGPAPVMMGGKMVLPKSRTYIASSNKDNPFYGAEYQSTLDAMPEPYRSLLTGGFQVSFSDAPNQIIPTEWVRMAQARWTRRPPDGVPMCAIGVDPSGGGKDPMVMAPRHDGWYAPLIEIPAKSIPQDKAGSFMAGMVVTYRRDAAIVVLDVGGGYGGGCLEVLRENDIDTRPYKGNGQSVKKTKDKQLGFFNTRTEALWKFREALDPDQPHGSSIALPDDQVLLADLTAPTLDMDYRGGLKAESKEDIVKRLGRSTNRGDAVIMAWHAGPKFSTDGAAWHRAPRALHRMPQVIMGRRR